MALPPDQYQPTLLISLTYFPLCPQLYLAFHLLIHWSWDSHFSHKGMSRRLRSIYYLPHPTSVDRSIGYRRHVRDKNFWIRVPLFNYTIPCQRDRQTTADHLLPSQRVSYISPSDDIATLTRSVVDNLVRECCIFLRTTSVSTFPLLYISPNHAYRCCGGHPISIHSATLQSVRLSNRSDLSSEPADAFVTESHAGYPPPIRLAHSTWRNTSFSCKTRIKPRKVQIGTTDPPSNNLALGYRTTWSLSLYKYYRAQWSTEPTPGCQTEPAERRSIALLRYWCVCWNSRWDCGYWGDYMAVGTNMGYSLARGSVTCS
jgi:hypothetical protein